MKGGSNMNKDKKIQELEYMIKETEEAIEMDKYQMQMLINDYGETKAKELVDILSYDDIKEEEQQLKKLKNELIEIKTWQPKNKEELNKYMENSIQLKIYKELIK